MPLKRLQYKINETTVVFIYYFRKILEFKIGRTNMKLNFTEVIWRIHLNT